MQLFITNDGRKPSLSTEDKLIKALVRGDINYSKSIIEEDNIKASEWALDWALDITTFEVVMFLESILI